MEAFSVWLRDKHCNPYYNNSKEKERHDLKNEVLHHMDVLIWNAKENTSCFKE